MRNLTGWRVARYAWLVLLPLATACQWGTRPTTLRVAQSAAGAEVAVRITDEPRDRVGELLAVDSAGLYLRETRLTYITWPRIRALDVAQLGLNYDLPPGRVATPEYKQRLTLISRFRSLPGDLLQQVLRSVGQDSLDVIR
ncbi:MAG: hypothetical protein K2R93_19170 [Gemmatimonadaceae bacterium]|nr:hypothetical protein [Gemmatimonadaceae bacterium]